MPELWNAMEPLTLVISTFNEAEMIGAAIREIPAAYRFDIIAADGAAPTAHSSRPSEQRLGDRCGAWLRPGLRTRRGHRSGR